MTGLETAALIGLIGGAAQGIAGAGKTLASGMSQFGSEKKKRLEELKRMEELGALGLSEAEIQQLMRNQLDPVRAQQQQRLEQQQALLGAANMSGSGQALASLQRAQMAEDKAIANANLQVELANEKRKREREQEMRMLEQAKDTAAAAPIAAASTLIGMTGEAGAKAYLKKAALEEMTGDKDEDTATAPEADENEDFWNVIGEF